MPARARKSLEWSRLSQRDLLSIEAFYADYSQRTADKVIASIRAAAIALEHTPFLGARVEYRGARRQVISAYPFCIIYRVKHKSVQILRVLHQARKYP